MEIYLIRHTTPAVAKGYIYGRTDVPLAETFTAEKAIILKKLPAGITRVFSSPSTRCTQLAAHISASYSTDARLYEVNFGQWEGKTWDTVKQEELDPWMQDYVHVCPPDGESMVQMQKRVMQFWEELLRQSQERTAIVTHGGVIRLLVAAIRQTPLVSLFDIKVAFGDVILVRPHQLSVEERLTVC